MANEENLTTPSASEARERGQKGGKASGAARRRKKSMREALIALMENPIPEDVKRKLEKTGIDLSDADYQDAILISQMLQAVGKGNTRAAVWLSEVMGERVQNIKVDQKIDDSRKELEAYFEQQKETGA